MILPLDVLGLVLQHCKYEAACALLQTCKGMEAVRARWRYKSRLWLNLKSEPSLVTIPWATELAVSSLTGKIHIVAPNVTTLLITTTSSTDIDNYHYYCLWWRGERSYTIETPLLTHLYVKNPNKINPVPTLEMLSIDTDHYMWRPAEEAASTVVLKHLTFTIGKKTIKENISMARLINSIRNRYIHDLIFNMVKYGCSVKIHDTTESKWYKPRPTKIDIVRNGALGGPVVVEVIKSF